MQGQQKDQKKPSVKDFIKHRKLQMKKVKGNQEQAQNLNQLIEDNDDQAFATSFVALQNQSVVYYLFSEDSLKTTPLIKILSTPQRQQFLAVVNSALQKNFDTINQAICSKWLQNQLVAYDWKNKLTTLNRAVAKIIIEQKDPQLKSQICHILLQAFSIPESFISCLYKQFLTFQIAKETLPPQKNKENLKQAASIFDHFYIPLISALSADSVGHLYLQFIGFKRQTVKQSIWIDQDFLTAIKENILDEFTFELKELGVNFMHQIFFTGSIKTIINVHELIQNSQNEEQRKLLRKAYLSYDLNSQLPVDIAFKTWPMKEIQELIKFMSSHHDSIRMSTNCVNIILQNQKLNQTQKQTLIETVLSEGFSSHGYVDSIKMEKSLDVKMPSSKETVHVFLPTNQISSVIVYDRKTLLSKKYKSSYPLIRYMDRFREQSQLKMVQQLFPSDLLDKKSTKMKISATIKLFWKVKDNPIQEGSEGHKHIQELLYYHTALVYMLCKMIPCECTEYLLNKIHINCPEMFFKKNDGIMEVYISRHFLVIYLENALELGPTAQNKGILEKVFGSKENEKFIGEKYNMYAQILKGLNQSSLFKRVQECSFMMNEVRSSLRSYFDVINEKELCKESLDVEYVKESSGYFFFVCVQDRSKKLKKAQKYSAKKDWGLYKADELFAKIDEKLLIQQLKHLQIQKIIENSVQNDHLPHDQNEDASPDVPNSAAQTSPISTDKQTQKKQLERQSILKAIFNFKKNISDDQQQEKDEEYPPFHKENQKFFKNKFKQYQSLNSLHKYLQKLHFDLANNQAVAVPQIIELSFHQKKLKQKIELIIREGFNFYFARLQVERIYKAKSDESSNALKLALEQNHENFQSNKNVVDDVLLFEVVERMVENATDLITALLHCKQTQTKFLQSLWQRKDRSEFLNMLMERFKQRNTGPPRMVKCFKHPQNAIEPIPFHMFLFIRQLAQQLEYKEYSSAVTIENLLSNLLLNLESKVLHVSQTENLKINKEKIEQEKELAVKEVVRQWEIGHDWIKKHMSYESHITQLVIEEAARQLKLAKEEKEQEQKPKKGKKTKKQQVQQIEQPEQQIIEQTLPEAAVHLKSYYTMLCERLLTKYHNKHGLKFNPIIQSLSPQELFLIDSYQTSTSNYGVFLVYAMESSSQPHQILTQRIQIQPLIKQLLGGRNHENVKITFMKQIERFSQQQFIQTLPEIQKHNFVSLSDMLYHVNDQEKLIYVLDYLLTGKAQNNKLKFTSSYLIGLIRENLPRFSTCIVLLVDKSDFKFWINQKTETGVRNLSCDNISFYSKCDSITFDYVLKCIQRYYVKENTIVADQTIKLKVDQLIRGLAENQAWKRMLQVLELKNFNNLEPFVQAAFEHVGKNLESSKNSLKTEADKAVFNSITERLFETFKNLSIPFDQNLFINAYKCSPAKAFDFMQPKILTLETFVSCLKAIPQEAKLFLTHIIEVNTEVKPEPKYFKANFPLTPYYFHQFGVCKWLIDVLRVERNLLKAFGEIKRLDKTMESLILLDQMEDNFSEFYTPEQIDLKCEKLLTSNSVTSIKKYPKEWFDNYLKTHPIKNLTIMTPDLLIELIDLNFVAKDNLLQIISTCKLPVIKHFLNKHSISLDLSTIKQIEQKNLGAKYKLSIWEFLTQIDNESFVIEFIKTYNLFEICPTQSYDDIFLTNVVVFKRLHLLSFLIEHFTQKAGRKLQFVFDKKGKIQSYLIALPQDIAVTMNFYEYQFIVKESNNECPDFYTSSRFLIEAENQNVELQKIHFIPQLQRRLHILHTLSAFTPIHQSINWKQNILLKNLLQLKIKENPNDTQQNQLKNPRWQPFIRYVADPSNQLPNEEPTGTLTELLVLYISSSKTGISIAQLQKSHPLDIKIIKSIQKYIDMNADLTSKAYQIIKTDTKLMAMVLENNFEHFMEHYKNDFESMSRVDSALTYIKAVLVNVKHFESNQFYQLYLKRFLELCFSDETEKSVESVKNLFLSKYLLQYLLLAFAENCMLTFNHLVLISKLAIGHSQPFSPGSILYLAATKTNERSIKGGSEPSFDTRGWTNVIEQIAQTKFPLNENRPSIHLQSFIQDSANSLSTHLNQKYRSKIVNLNSLLQQIVAHAQKVTKYNIYILISILLNQTYLIYSFHEFYHAVKASLKLKKETHLSLEIEFSSDQQFKTKFIKIQGQKNENQVVYTLPISWTKVQNDLPLMFFDIDSTLQNCEKELILQKMKQNPEIEVLNRKYATESRYLRNMKFSFDTESFSKVQKSSWLKNMIEHLPMTSNGISQIEKIMDDLDDNAYMDKTLRYYSLSDVYGPVRVTDDGSNADKVIDCMSFYELMDLPRENIVVEYAAERPSAESCSKNFVDDFEKYIRYMLNEARDEHPQDKVKAYDFSHRIQLFIDQRNQQITAYTHNFYLANILKYFSLVNGASDEIRRLFQNRIDARYDVRSLNLLFSKFKQLKHDLKTPAEKETHLAYGFARSFLKSRSNSGLVERVLLMIIDDAVNIMKVLKGTLVGYEIVERKQQHQLYKMFKSVFVSGLDYAIEDQILRIKVQVILEPNESVIKQVSLEEADVVSRKQFLSSIFSSTEFLTDYFLEKNLINNECIKVSRGLTKKLNKTVNLHVDYKSLYSFIDWLKNQVSIKEIDGYLYVLRTYLIVNMDKKLTEYSSSDFVLDHHQILLLNTFELLHLSLSKNNKIAYNSIDNQIQNLNCQKQLTYFFNKTHNQKGLQLLEGYNQEINNLDETAKNSFLIQIFKSYFTTIVTEGMTFIVGFKQSNKPPTLIKFINRTDIDKINIIEVSYMLLVTSTIPTPDELDHRKIIRIFVSDLYKNVYQISETVKNYLLTLNQDDSEMRNITNLLPIIPSNLVIEFDHLNNKLSEKSSKQRLGKDAKTFEIKLEKQSKLRLLPSKSQPMLLHNYLKKCIPLQKQIVQFIEKTSKKWGTNDLRLTIDTSKVSQEVNLQKIAEMIKLSFFDIESALNLFLTQSSRKPDLETLYSIYENMSVKENVLVQLRKQLFLKHFKQIRLQVSQTLSPNIRINQDQIVLQIGFIGENKFVKERDIAHEILKFLAQKSLANNSTKITFEEINEAETMELLKALDIFNTIEMQIKQLKKAAQIYEFLNTQKSYKNFKSLAVLQRSKKSYISSAQTNNTIFLHFNIQNQQCQFFTCSDLLTVMMNNFKQDLTFDHHQTSFQLNEKSIKLRDMAIQKPLLVIEVNNKILSYQEKAITENGSSRRLDIANILQKIQLDQNRSHCYWVIDRENSKVCSNFIYFLNKNSGSELVDKKLTSFSTNQKVSLIVQSDSHAINMNTCPITMSVLLPNDNHLHTYQSIFREQFKHNFEVRILSKQIAEINLTFNASCGVSINLAGYKNVLDSKTEIFLMTFSSTREAIIQNTKFIEVHFRNKVTQSKEIKASEVKKKTKQKAFIEPAQKASVSYDMEMNVEKGKKVTNIESLVYVVNNESKNYLTRAGQKRVDFIQVCDADFNPIDYKGEINFYFKHINNLCKVIPEITKHGLKIALDWSPNIRGHYRAFFNGICLNPDYEIGVCAAVADPEKSTIEQPKIRKICFVEETEFTFNLVDSYENIYTELEQNILGDGLLIEIESDKPEITKYLKKKEEKINKYGAKKIRFSIDDNSASESATTVITVSLNKHKMCEFELKIDGQSLTQRKKNLNKQVAALNKGFYKDAMISRTNFIQDLFKIAEKSLITNFSIKFSGEQGIDAGGLKREFYDMIGNEMKSQNNPFFKATSAKKNFYFFNPELLKNKKKEKYMELFGKFLANSILNSYLIGINFSPVFVKLLFNDPIDFDDLMEVVSEEEAKRYKYLTYAPAEDFEDLEIYFSVIVDKKKGTFLQLKQDGANIQVTHQNVKEYLDLLTKSLIQQRYKEVTDAFRNGFQSVIPLNVVRKWVRPREFWCITQGAKQINAELVLEYTIFDGSADEGIKAWFRRYINEASPEVLEGFLKFTSGSSSIDLEAQKLTVTFENASGNTKKLPISHTCWKQIVVPKYKSYEIMQKLLNAAFIFCSEGFGFG